MGRNDTPAGTPDSSDTAEAETAVNKSGFPFQLAVEKTIQRTAPSHGWSVLPHEHPWYEARRQEDAFIDIIIEKEGIRGIVECKRNFESQWIFLIPDDKEIKATARLAFGLVYKKGDRHASTSVSFDEFALQPILPEAEFCVIRNPQKNRDEQMLERISAQLVRSTQAVGKQAMETERHSGNSEHLYLPIIVTNAALTVCRFDASKVSLSSGALPNDAQFKNEEAVYFRRSLGPAKSGEALRQIQPASERTVLVARAEYLARLLLDVRVIGRGPLQRFEEQYG